MKKNPNNFKRTVIRLSKCFHMGMTFLLFLCCWRLNYQGQGSGLLVLTAYFVLAMFFMKTYSAYQVGLSRIRMLVYSQTLGDTAVAGTVYILMLLDNLSVISPLPLIGLLMVQFLWNVAWSYLTNTLYFRLYQPRSTVILYREQQDLSRLQEIYRHDRKFHVEKTVAISSQDVQQMIREIQGFEAVFVTGIDATMRNEIEKYCVEHDIRCYLMPHVGDVIMMGAKHLESFSVPVLRITRAAPGLGYAAMKRGIDVLCSLLGIVVLSPLMALTALSIRLYDGGPAIYKQVRLTKDRREFYIYKFRSMRVDAEKDGVARLASSNDDRITPVGKVIRACRLDELPQLFNILRGDMSIVGPRPERPEIAQQYEQDMPSFGLRLQVRAGLTGLAQVYGKYNTDPYDKLRMDLMYINQMSLLEDLKLVFATVKVLFMKESTSGVAADQITAAMRKETTEFAVK